MWSEGKKFLSSPKRPERLWGTQLVSYSVGVKRPGHEVNHFPLPRSSAEVIN
jgi:hypothetical protein